MMKQRVFVTLVILVCIAFVSSCDQDPEINLDPISNPDDGPRPYHLKVPEGFPDYFLEDENRLTFEGIELGKKLFFDPKLSRNQDVSCGSCHTVETSFTDPRSKSIGTNGDSTTFHSMAIFNIAWMNEFFWDGRAKSREDQALLPVINPLEMDMTWPEVIDRLYADEDYPELFKRTMTSTTMAWTAKKMFSRGCLAVQETLKITASSKLQRFETLHSLLPTCMMVALTPFEK